MGEDEQIRCAAFEQLRYLERVFGDAIPWSAVEGGFHLSGTRLHLSGRARGIFRPRQMRRGVLSVKTTMPRQGRQRRYDDIASDEGYFEYRFMGNDPNSADNRWLRESMEDVTPLIYFHAVAPSIYQAIRVPLTENCP